MRILSLTLMCAIILINLTSCSSIHSVTSRPAPTMEEVYDNMGQSPSSLPDYQPKKDQQDVKKVRGDVPAAQYKESALPIHVSAAVDQTFKKVPNPELKMYVYPHLAGQEEVPIPGYFTAFNAFERDYYELPIESSGR